jgi:alginate O-acetyltransferase complex protein AlgI
MSYSTYVTFFPELIAGPIVRASIFLPQMGRAIGPTAERLHTGASIFLVGLTKKLFVADRLAGVADPIFAAPQTYAPATLWMGTLAYALQIYCDFSGYSDMAIGTAKMIGYDLPRNFRMPYLAGDVSEFWRRWHITLSSWLRDYLYIPLGGNRRGRARTYLNLMLTMLLGGLWHGASWNFVLWGGLHGLALALHRALKSAVRDRPLLPALAGTPVTFLFVLLCWVPFRSPDWPTTEAMLRKMLSPGAQGVLFVPAALFGCLALVALGHAIGTLLDRAVAEREPPAWLARWLARFSCELLQDDISGWYLRFGARTAAGSFLLAGWLLMLFFFSPTGTSPFIYFRF